VTPDGYIDAAISIGKRKDAIVATFGDMIKVPGSASSLEKERGICADVRIVYSPLDAVRTAAENPGKEVVFLGVGFETTAPAIAGAIEAAARSGLRNFSVLSSVRTIPRRWRSWPAIRPSDRVYLCPPTSA
jgi:hydrogenase expression/formation protein HypD